MVFPKFEVYRRCVPGVPCACDAVDYGERGCTLFNPRNLRSCVLADGTIICSCTLNLAAPATCVVMAALFGSFDILPAWLAIERPYGVDVTDQRDYIMSEQRMLHHLETCERLDAGVYTWNLVNRRGANIGIDAAWIKVQSVV